MQDSESDRNDAQGYPLLQHDRIAKTKHAGWAGPPHMLSAFPRILRSLVAWTRTARVFGGLLSAFLLAEVSVFISTQTWAFLRGNKLRLGSLGMPVVMCAHAKETTCGKEIRGCARGGCH